MEVGTERLSFHGMHACSSRSFPRELILFLCRDVMTNRDIVSPYTAVKGDAHSVHCVCFAPERKCLVSPRHPLRRRLSMSNRVDVPPILSRLVRTLNFYGHRRTDEGVQELRWWVKASRRRAGSDDVLRPDHGAAGSQRRRKGQRRHSLPFQLLVLSSSRLI